MVLYKLLNFKFTQRIAWQIKILSKWNKFKKKLVSDARSDVGNRRRKILQGKYILIVHRYRFSVVSFITHPHILFFKKLCNEVFDKVCLNEFEYDVVLTTALRNIIEDALAESSRNRGGIIKSKNNNNILDYFQHDFCSGFSPAQNEIRWKMPTNHFDASAGDLKTIFFFWKTFRESSNKEKYSWKTVVKTNVRVSEFGHRNRWPLAAEKQLRDGPPKTAKTSLTFRFGLRASISFRVYISHEGGRRDPAETVFIELRARRFSLTSRQPLVQCWREISTDKRV